MNKSYKGCLLIMVCCFCISWSPTGQQYAEAVSGKSPAEFSKMKGAQRFRCKISDGKNYSGEEVTNLCFRDNTYGDLNRDEGDTYIKGTREGSDIETSISLNNISKIEILEENGSRLFVKEKNAGELFFRIRVHFNTGSPPEVLTVSPRLAVAFTRVGVGDERAYLYKLDMIEDVEPDEVSYNSGDEVPVR